MQTEDSIKIIETILLSMRQNPAQFQFNISVHTTGAIGIGGSGGAGIVATANAPGSIGFSASASSPSQMQMQIIEGQANHELNSQFQAIDTLLQNIVLELKNNSLDNQKRDTFIGQLKSTWLPNVVVSMISLALSSL